MPFTELRWGACALPTAVTALAVLKIIGSCVFPRRHWEWVGMQEDVIVLTMFATGWLGGGIHAMTAGTRVVFSSWWDLDVEMDTHFMPGVCVQLDSVCSCFSYLHHSSSP